MLKPGMMIDPVQPLPPSSDKPTMRLSSLPGICATPAQRPAALSAAGHSAALANKIVATNRSTVVVELCCRLGALNCFRGLRNRSRVDRADRQCDSLHRKLPDRKERAQDHGEIDRALKNAAFLFFGAHEQRVGRFESFGRVGFVFHMFGLVDDRLYCKARATSSRRVLSH